MRSSGFDGSEARASFKADNESCCSISCSSSWFSRALFSSSSAIAATILRDQGRRPDTRCSEETTVASFMSDGWQVLLFYTLIYLDGSNLRIIIITIVFNVFGKLYCIVVLIKLYATSWGSFFYSCFIIKHEIKYFFIHFISLNPDYQCVLKVFKKIFFLF